MKTFTAVVVFVVMVFTGERMCGQIIYPPNLYCALITQSGNVQLSWDLPNDTCGSFNAYLIYRSDDSMNGPFFHLFSISNSIITSCVDFSGNANSVPYCYYMLSDFDCPGIAISSDTLCAVDSCSTINIVHDVHHNELIFFLFPNPFTTHLQLHYTLTQPGELMVYDALGRKVKSVTLAASQKTFELSMAELPGGVYLVAVNSSGRVWGEKVVKE